MDVNNPVIRLCLEGTQAEFKGQIGAARAFYQQAWEAAQDDYEACIAAHYLARRQENPAVELGWNLEALRRAEAVDDLRAAEFFPSLYLNLGASYEKLGNQIESQRYYDLAAGLGFPHQASTTS